MNNITTNKTKTMKKINWLVALLSVFSLTFAACGGDDVVEPNKPVKLPETSTVSFKVAVTELTHDAVSYTVTPLDAEKEYFCVVDTAEVIEEFTRDKYLVSTLNQNLTEAASSIGLTIEEYAVEVCDKGGVERTYKGLEPSSDYYILVVSVDDVLSEANSPEILKLKFTTAPAPVVELTFDIEANVNGTDATIKVTPSDKSAIWFYTLLPSAQYAQYLDPEAYGLTPEKVIEILYTDQLNQLMNNGMDIYHAINETFHICSDTVPSKSFNVSNLYYNTEYTNIIAGFIIDADANITRATPVMTSTFTTGDIGEVDLTFEITVDNIEAMRASIKVVPSDKNHTFYWQVGEYDGKSTAEEVMATTTPYGTYKGVQDYTGGLGSPYKMTLESPDTEYYVIAYGYAPGAGVTTAPKMVTFRTLTAPPAEETTFTIKASSVTAYGFTIKVTSSEASTYYIVDVVSPEEFDEAAIVKSYDDLFAADYLLWEEAYPGITYSQFWYSYAYNGNAYRGTVSLDVTTAPGSTLMGYICAVDVKTNKVVKVHTFENLATTPSLCDVTPTVKILGYYSGRDENGQIFGDAEYTKNSAIMVVKYEGIEQARSLFSYMTEEELSNIINYPDVDIWNFIRNSGSSWSALKDINIPYEFYLVNWNTDNTVFAYIIDKSGVMSHIGRATGKATAENKGKIGDLLQLVNELYPPKSDKASLKLPASIVVEE